MSSKDGRKAKMAWESTALSSGIKVMAGCAAVGAFALFQAEAGPRLALDLPRVTIVGKRESVDAGAAVAKAKAKTPAKARAQTAEADDAASGS